MSKHTNCDKTNNVSDFAQTTRPTQHERRKCSFLGPGRCARRAESATEPRQRLGMRDKTSSADTRSWTRRRAFSSFSYLGVCRFAVSARATRTARAPTSTSPPIPSPTLSPTCSPCDPPARYTRRSSLSSRSARASRTPPPPPPPIRPRPAARCSRPSRLLATPRSPTLRSPPSPPSPTSAGIHTATRADAPAPRSRRPASWTSKRAAATKSAAPATPAPAPRSTPRWTSTHPAAAAAASCRRTWAAAAAKGTATATRPPTWKPATLQKSADTSIPHHRFAAWADRFWKTRSIRVRPHGWSRVL